MKNFVKWRPKWGKRGKRRKKERKRKEKEKKEEEKREKKGRGMYGIAPCAWDCFPNNPQELLKSCVCNVRSFCFEFRKFKKNVWGGGFLLRESRFVLQCVWGRRHGRAPFPQIYELLKHTTPFCCHTTSQTIGIHRNRFRQTSSVRFCVWTDIVQVYR